MIYDHAVAVIDGFIDANHKAGYSVMSSKLGIDFSDDIGIDPDNKYSLWVDTSEDAADAMRADAIKYKTFSIATSAWSGSGPYTYTMTATGITENSAKTYHLTKL